MCLIEKKNAHFILIKQFLFCITHTQFLFDNHLDTMTKDKLTEQKLVIITRFDVLRQV